MSNHLVFGRNETQRIVCVEPGIGPTTTLFIQDAEGSVKTKDVPNSHWMIYTEQLSPKMKELKGNQPYKWLMEYDDKGKWNEVLKASREKRLDLHVCRNDKEAFLTKNGYTYFKGMKANEIGVLSFDIETNGLSRDRNSKVLLITNTVRSPDGKVVRRTFSHDEFQNQRELIDTWCAWVRACDPSLVIGHNIYAFDLPYLSHVAKREGTSLKLGRNDSAIVFERNVSKFRKDGSQAYDYNNALIYGREIVDTFFLAIKFDVARKYESYGLKQIIKQEGLERTDRQYVDASRIKELANIPEEWAKVKLYAEQDADDALALYDLMIPSFFYYTQSIPRSFQHIINTATGSQLNSLMVRCYLQEGHSIARTSEKVEYEGGISFGIPGIHKNVLRIDAVSMYPSIIRTHEIYAKDKDPNRIFLRLVNYFTEERLRNKALAKVTGDRHYKDLEQAMKIVINSFYGFLGAPRANYNYPKGAAEVTRQGRTLLTNAIKWATGKEYQPEGVDDETEECA